MKLSELKKSVDNALTKFGDRDVYVDTEARTFDCPYVPTIYAGMPLDDNYYKNHPDDLESKSGLGDFIITLNHS